MYKRTSILVAFLTIILFSIQLSCGKEEAVNTEQERTTLRERINTTVDSIDRRITELQVRIETATGDSASMVNEKIEDLRETRTDLGQRLERMATVAENEWGDFRKETDEAIIEAERKLKDIGE